MVPRARRFHLTAPASLDTLCITDSRFTDKGLEHIEQFRQLRELGLSRTSVSDAGLARIAALTQLTTLTLSLTDVSDDGLAALAECKQLRWIDLSMTSVTAAGAKRLSEALPDAKITIGACDAVVRAAVLDYSGDVRLERLHACGKAQTFGLPPSPSAVVGLSVTDAGLKLLNTHMQLKTLDLRYTAITDSGLINVAATGRRFHPVWRSYRSSGRAFAATWVVRLGRGKRMKKPDSSDGHGSQAFARSLA